jgi:hypothetical protein
MLLDYKLHFIWSTFVLYYVADNSLRAHSNIEIGKGAYMLFGNCLLK